MINVTVVKPFLLRGAATTPGDVVALEPTTAKELMARGRVALWIAPQEVIPELDELTDSELLDLAAEYQLKRPKKADRTELLELIRAHEAAAAGAP